MDRYWDRDAVDTRDAGIFMTDIQGYSIYTDSISRDGLDAA